MSQSLPLTLVRALAPKVYLHPEEAFTPCSVDWYLPRVSLWKDNTTCVLSIGQVNAQSLYQVQRAIGEAKLSMRVEPPPYDTIDIERHPTYLGQGTSSPCYFLSKYRSDGLYYLRYFFFYAYNGGLLANISNRLGYQAHEGDWEYITVLLGYDDQKQECTLHTLAFSGHGYTTYEEFFPGVSTPISGLQPITVYSALNSHASYATAGDHPLLNIPAFLRPLIGGYDQAGDGSLWDTGSNLVEIAITESPAQPLWAAYNGDWGTDVEVGGFPVEKRVEGPSGPLSKDLSLGFLSSVDAFYQPQEGQKFRCSDNFPGWDVPDGYLNVRVDTNGRLGVPVFSFDCDKTAAPDTRWYSFKKNGDSFATESSKPGNGGGSGEQKIYLGTASPTPPGANGNDTYNVVVFWSAAPLPQTFAVTRPPRAVLMGSVSATYKPQKGQTFRCSPNIPDWNVSELDDLYFEIVLGAGQIEYPVFAVDHDKRGADTRWYTGVTHGSYFPCLSQNGGTGSQKIYLGTISALPDGVKGDEVFTVSVYRVPALSRARTSDITQSGAVRRLANKERVVYTCGAATKRGSACLNRVKKGGTRCHRHRVLAETVALPVTIGSTISLKNASPLASDGGFLNTCGYLGYQPDFKIYPDVSFTFGAQLSERNLRSCIWKILSASGKRTGEPLIIGDAVHLLNAYPTCGYLDACGAVVGSPTFASFPEHLLVFTSGVPDRDSGSGTWTVRSALGQPDGTAVREGDAIHLENGFPGGGFLDTCGYVKDVPAFRSFPPAQQVFVFTSSSADRDSGSGTWRVALNGSPAFFQTMSDVFFNFPNRYDSGIIPSVGVANGTVVEVHQSQGASTLWYNVGGLTGDLVGFGASQKYDDGIHPAVAVNAGGTVVEVHETQSPFSSGMYYHVGQVDASNKAIALGSSHNYDSGNKPRVALNNSNVVVEVHESNGPSSNMWYHVGIVAPSEKTIAFGSSHNYDSGVTPSIAINNENVAVEVHQSDGLSTNLWYHVGVVDPTGKTIAFGASHNYDSGANPSVALADDGFVIEIHQSQSFNTLWKRIGRVDVANKTINWIGSSVYYCDGSNPAVASDGTMAVQVNQSGSSLYCAASMVIDRTSWMADNLSLIGDKSLMEVALPASHDAGMGITQDCRLARDCNTKTQNHTILGQLQVGSRYFDIRPVIYNGAMYTGHYSVNATLGTLGCNGQSIADVLNDVKSYLENGRDLVILKFSHYFDRDGGGGFSDQQMKTLLEQVTKALQPWLYIGSVPSGGLQSVKVNDYIGTGGKVLAVFDKLSDPLKSQFSGVYSYADKGSLGDLVVYDEYADSNDLDTMISDQLSKLANAANHGDNLFLLSWTLTQSTAQAIACATLAAPSILDLAQQADVALWPALVSAYQRGMISSTRMVNLIYADNIQGTQTDFAIWLNQQL